MTPAPSPARRVRDRGVRSRIVGVVVAAVIVAVAAGLLGVTALASATDRTRAMYEQHTVGVQLAVEARYQYSAYRFASLNRASAPTPDIADQYQAQRDEAQTALLAALEGLRARAVDGGTVLAAVAQVQDDVTSYVQLTAQLEQLAADGRIVEFNQLRGSEVGPLSGRLLDALDGLAAAVQEEARASVADAVDAEQRTRTSILVLVGAGGLLALLGGALLAHGIGRNLARLRRTAERLAAGDLTGSTGLVLGDDVGRTAAALDAAMASLREVMTTVAGSAEAITASSEELSATSVETAAASGRNSVPAGVATATGAVSRSVQTVAAGAEQLDGSLREVARSVDEAARVAEDAVAETERTTTAVARLGDSSREIGDVVKVITSIAEQTNLLALNATIEAARAGQAGKGFAVVAGEVKELARETAAATEDIARRVQAIQGDTAGAVAAIGRISEVITRIDEYQRTIAAAVEQQSATVREISRSVGSAADGVERITQAVADETGYPAADSADRVAGRARTAVDELSRTAVDLRTTVSRFHYRQ